MWRYSFLNLAWQALRRERRLEPGVAQSPQCGRRTKWWSLAGAGMVSPRRIFLRRNMAFAALQFFEKGWIGGGNSGRNTQVTRSTYFCPVSLNCFDHSLKLYEPLGRELNFIVGPVPGRAPGLRIRRGIACADRVS